MARSGLAQTPAEDTPQRLRIPLFPLNTVLFPDGILALRIFEQRYLDMAAACMRTSSPFGVCLISAGAEVGAAAAPYAVGTLARISDWDMEQLGLLQVAALGGQRFRLLSSSSAADKLLQGEVELIEDDGPLPLPPEFSRLLPLLRRIVDEAGPTRIGEPHRLDDAEWVGYRLSEALPLPNQVKQKLLELADPLARLAILEKSLDQRQLLD